MSEQRDNSGSIGKNERKEKETHPDMSGSVMVNGKVMWISGWFKVHDGKKFISLAFKDKEMSAGQRADAIAASTAQKAAADPEAFFNDDDIPF